MINYKLIATQFGESIKYDSTLNEIDRVFLSLTNVTIEPYPNPAITSKRSQEVYNWVMSISNSNMNENQKVKLITSAIKLLAMKDSTQLKLLSLLPRKKSDATIHIKSGGNNYVHKERIKELANLKNENFSFIKLIQLCKEINLAFSNKSYLSVAMLLRAILDHIPPLFNQNNFSQVANNYGTGSFKESMLNLNNSSKKISDYYLHTQIRKKEVLPNSNQVDFSNDLDLLLQEIVRIS